MPFNNHHNINRQSNLVLLLYRFNMSHCITTNITTTATTITITMTTVTTFNNIVTDVEDDDDLDNDANENDVNTMVKAFR